MSSGRNGRPRRNYPVGQAPPLDADPATILAQWKAGVNPLADPENFRAAGRRGYFVRDTRDPKKGGHKVARRGAP